MNKIKKKKIYKNIYELEINFDQKDKSKNVKENYILMEEASQQSVLIEK
jgi:hypothetical protein